MLGIHEGDPMQTHRTLAHDQWTEYLDGVSHDLADGEVSIETVDPPFSSQIEAARLALQFVAYDGRDDVFQVAAVADNPPSVVRHLVDRPERILVEVGPGAAPMMIAVDGQDGVRTVITIERDRP